MPERQDLSYSPLDVLGSPIYNVFESVSKLPGVNQTGFNRWLRHEPAFGGVRNFQRQEPGWALGADVAGALVPFAGWAGATAKAGTGLMGATNAFARGAAALAPKSPMLAFALGETARFAPLSAGVTAFDYAAGNYDSALDAAGNFVVWNALGVPFQMAGHGLVPAMERFAPKLVSAPWKAVFEPGPELSKMYGFSDNVRRAADRASRVPAVQEAVSPLLEPQMRAAALWDLRDEVRAAQATAATGGIPANPALLEVDPGLLDSQYDTEIRAILGQELGPGERGWRWAGSEDDSPKVRNTMDGLLRSGPTYNGARVRVPLTGSGSGPSNPEVLGQLLGMPPGWIHNSQFPGITQVTRKGDVELNFRRELGLEPGTAGRNFRVLRRDMPEGGTQDWSVRKEPGTNLWLLTAQVPGDWTMSGRRKFPGTQNLSAREPASAYFTVKTSRPQDILPGLDIDPDGTQQAVGPGSWSLESRIPRGQSAFLDKALDFRDQFLSPQTLAGGHSRKDRAAYVREMLAGPGPGKQLAQWFETYTAPTARQLGDNPEAKGVLGTYQALFDAAEGRTLRILHGLASVPEGKSAIATLFSDANIDDAAALIPNLRRAVQEDPEVLEQIRRWDKQEDLKLEDLGDSPAAAWINLAKATADRELNEINKPIGLLRDVQATSSRQIPYRQDHIALSRRWDGSVMIPVFKAGAVEPDAVIAGNGTAQAQRKASAWLEARAADLKAKGLPAEVRRLGKAFVAEEDAEIPAYIRQVASSPGLLEPRAGMMGYEHQYEPYKHVDELIAELEEGYMQRSRYLASTVADALTGGKQNSVLTQDPHAWNILKTRIAQLKGQPGPFEAFQNRILDKALAPMIGTNSATKTAEALNELNFHMLHGVGRISTPVLNLTSLLQTQLPEGINFLTSSPEALRGFGYQIPIAGNDGLPRPGFHFIQDPLGLLWNGVRRVMKPNEADQEIINEIFNRKIMGQSLANEYTGQDRGIAARASEGIRGPEDVAHWAKWLSSFLMAKTEQVSRTWSMGMSLEAMAKYEAMHGVKFTKDQKLANVANMVNNTNYGYFKADRPMMYTTPLGSVFGNQKTWMVNYLFMMAEYAGLAGKGNVAPLLFSLGTTGLLGGVFAVPLLGAGIDAAAGLLADKDGAEYIYEKMGEGGNAISFGAPALFGVSLAQNTAAPGSNLAHDAEFLFTMVAWERAKLMAKAAGRAWEDQMVLGIDPMKDPVFRQQLAQNGPRGLYSLSQALFDDTLKSASTGYPLVKEFGPGARFLHALGFQETDIAVQYAAYERLLKDRNAMREKVGTFGDAYARAALSNDRQEMMRLLQVAAVQGVDVNSVTRSAQVRMRNQGYDMMGRQFTNQQLEAYQAMLESSGRGSER